MAEKGGGRCRCLVRAEEGAGVAPERRRRWPAGSGAGRERRWAAALRGAEGGGHHRGVAAAAEKFWCGGPDARRGIMIGAGEGFPDTARYSWDFISLSLFLPGNSSLGRFKAAVPFAFPEQAKLRSRDQVVCQKYRLRLIRAPCLRHQAHTRTNL